MLQSPRGWKIAFHFRRKAQVDKARLERKGGEEEALIEGFEVALHKGAGCDIQNGQGTLQYGAIRKDVISQSEAPVGLKNAVS